MIILQAYILCCLTEHPDGTVVAALPNPAITSEVLVKVLQRKKNGMSEEHIIKELRKETVPPGYTYHRRTIGTGILVSLP